MKYILWFIVLPLYVLAQTPNSTVQKIENKTGGFKFSPRRYKDADSVAVNVTLPQTTTTAATALTLGQSNATKVVSLSTNQATQQGLIDALRTTQSTTQYNIIGTWNPSTNSPSLSTSTTLTAGSAYVVSTTVTSGVASTVATGSSATYVTGDMLVATTQGTWVRLSQTAIVADGAITGEKLATDLAAVITKGANLVDKSLLLNGYLWSNSTGNLLAVAGYKCYPTLIKLKTNTTYTISGANTDFLGGLYNSAGVRQSKLNTPIGGTRLTGITFTTGAADNYLGLNVSSVESTTPNAADNTIMLAEGTTTIYVPYIGYVIPGSRVQGVPVGAASTADLTPISSLANSNSATLSNIVGLSYNQYYTFDGTAYVNLPNSYTLDAVGDYIDFYASSTSGASLPSQGLGLFGKYTANQQTNKIGFYSSTQLGLRGDALDAYTLWTVPGGISDLKRYRIEVTSSGWQLSVDGAVVSTQTKPRALIINNIGSSYGTNFLGSLKSFTISTAISGTLAATNVKAISGSVNVQEVLTKQVDDSNLASTLAPVYLSYNPTGSSTGHELFTVYVKYAPNSLFYAGYQVAHQNDASIRQDIYRIYKADLYKYSTTGGMVAQGKALQTLGESESVYQISGATDATGGFHGDEKYTSIRLYIDGIPLSTTQLSGAFSLSACSQFHYEQISNMYQTDNATDVIQCVHKKLTTFKDAGYTTTNNLTFTSSPPSLISIWYSGISCITLEQSGTFYSENLSYVTTDNQSTPKLNETGVRTVRFYNATNKLGAQVSSTITKAKAGSTDNTSTYDNATLTVIYEQAAVRTKYYRELLSKSPVAGEVWESTTIAKHLMEN